MSNMRRGGRSKSSIMFDGPPSGDVRAFAVWSFRPARRPAVATGRVPWVRSSARSRSTMPPSPGNRGNVFLGQEPCRFRRTLPWAGMLRPPAMGTVDRPWVHIFRPLSGPPVGGALASGSLAGGGYNRAPMLTRILLQNFKGHLETPIEAAPFTIFIGPNNSGKSGVFHALLALRQAIQTNQFCPLVNRQATQPPT